MLRNGAAQKIVKKFAIGLQASVELMLYLRGSDAYSSNNAPRPLPVLDVSWPQIFSLSGLVLLSALFSGSEAAVISISKLRVRTLAESGQKRGIILERLVGDRNTLLTTILVGNTIVLLAADSLATNIFIASGIDHAAIWSTVVMTVVLLLFGEIIPKTISVTNNELWALRLVPFLRLAVNVLGPITWLAIAVTNALMKLCGARNSFTGPFVTEEDIRTIVNVGVEQKVLEEQERELIHSVIQFGDTIVREVMTPRPDMVSIEMHASPARALDLVIAEGYSKLPVYDVSIDDIVGVVHDRELLIGLANGSIATTSLALLMRPVTLVPESKRISELLREMQRSKFSLAVVVDEYGGTAGLVTMEDLLEEIVGELRDEHDEGEEEPIRSGGPGETLVDAGMNIEDVNATLGLNLPHEDFETIGGFTVGLFGRLPLQGDEIAADDDIRIRVDRTRGRRILTVRIINIAEKLKADTAAALNDSTQSAHS
jgi:putative hemolysin